MSKLIEKDATILVDSSWDYEADTERYRIWDESRTIPRPSEGVLSAEVFLEGRWEQMFFNCVWGRRYDPDMEGTWLKQKKSKRFSTTTGRRSCKVRYKVIG